MPYTIARHAGYCAGVRKAMEIALRAAKEAKAAGIPCFSLGELIHNPDAVEELPAEAFSGCANLRKITFKGAALGKVKSNAFAGIKANAVVTCPKAKLARYTKLLQKAGLSQTARFKAK